MAFFCQTKINFAKPRPFSTSKMELFVTIVDSWKLLISVVNSLDPPLLTYDFQRTEKDSSNVASLLVYVDGGRPFCSFLIQTQNVIKISMKLFRNFSMPEKDLKMLLNISRNVNLAARLSWGQPSILMQEFYEVCLQKLWTPMPKCDFNTIKLLSIFIEIILRHRCSPVNLLYIFRTPFPKNTSGRLLLY